VYEEEILNDLESKKTEINPSLETPVSPLKYNQTDRSSLRLTDR